MSKILPSLIAALILTWLTERTTYGRFGINKPQHWLNRFLFILLILVLAMPIALRKSYNDTGAYIYSFQQADTLGVLLESGTLHILGNPAFRVYEALVRTFTDNYLVFFLVPAIFVQYSYLRFIRRHCPNFLMGVMIFLFLGTYTFSIAAMKQTIAMAILLFAVDALIDRRMIRFFLLVFVAFLFHTYAIAFLILPLCTVRPWSPRTFLLLLGVYVVMANFNQIIVEFLEFANESGKSISSEEVIGTAAINPIRVAVYAVVPIIALVFRRRLFYSGTDREHHILVNMSILTVAIMSIGLVNAANMFARMGQYFEFGLICSLPWMLHKIFDRRSERLMTAITLTCFLGYFLYANFVQIYFDDHFGRYSLFFFIRSLIP